MIAFETTVRIKRPISVVYDYVSDPLNFRRWNSAVREVRENSRGKSYSMERRLGTGRAVNELEIVGTEAPHEFAIRTTSGPTPFLYRYSFSPEGDETVVQLNALFELNGVGTFVPQLAQRAVKKGVDDNLAALKRILESAVS